MDIRENYYCRKCHHIHRAGSWIHTQHLSWSSPIRIDTTMEDDTNGKFEGEL